MRSTMTRICITGGEGQLASALSLYFPFASYPGRKKLDVSDGESCDRYFSQRSFALIIHTAAETAHNAPREMLESVNVDGTWNVTRWAEVQHARMVYISTDYAGARKETDPVNPIGPYAESKVAGEMAVQAQLTNYLIVRGSFYTCLNYMRACTDAYTSKVPIHVAAAHIAALATSSATGIVNIGGARRSMYEIVATEFNPRTAAITRAQLKADGMPYVMPADVSLDTSRARSLGIF